MERARHYQTTTRDTLTPRQREVLELIARGRTNGEIAEQLGITLDGAKFHVREILAKLEVESREEAASWWRKDQSPWSRLGSALHSLISGLPLKPFAAVAGAAGTVAVAGYIAFAMSNGTEKARALPRCDPDALSWSTDSSRSVDDPGKMTYTASAWTWNDCELSAVVGVGAYAAQFDSPTSSPGRFGSGGTFVSSGPRIAVAIENQPVGTAKRALISGTVANLCGGPDVLLVIQTPAQTSYRLSVPFVPCMDPETPMQFEAEWTANKLAREAALRR